MRTRAYLLWVLFGLALCAAVLLVAGIFWLILGPAGPPTPWRTTPPAAQSITPATAATATPTAVVPPTPMGVSPGVPTPTLAPRDKDTPTPTFTPLPPPPTATPYQPVTPPPVGAGEDTARRLAETYLPPRDLVEINGRLVSQGDPPPRTVPPDEQPYTVGRVDTFWISDSSFGGSRQINATLEVISPHAYFYVEEGTGLSRADLEEAARVFEDEIYPTTREYFGTEWTPGVDGDPHVVILHASFEDAAGYFSSMDEVPQKVNSFSNQREMFYMSIYGAPVGSFFYYSTLAHEFQHMIHWYQDLRCDAWVDEGMAQMSEEVNNYNTSNMVDSFLQNPDLQLTTWTDQGGQNLAHYAASYLWFHYFAQRMGGPDVLREVLDPAVDDITAIETVLEARGYTPVVTAPRLFDAFFADWAVANYLDNPYLDDGRYGYTSGIDLGNLWVGERVYGLPWETAATVYPYATDYIDVSGGQQGTLRIFFDGEETLPLVDTTAHSGTHFWWSNRGDLADAQLTRSFDLSAVDQATLTFWMWYDIELDYDYAYVEVSTDGGESWEILPGQHTTTFNPYGNNLGHGYTGSSGGGYEPQWVQERIDLSAYAGQEVLLRFEMISDDSINYPNLALEDLEIPEIGFYDDMEGDTGWEANGFVWVDNLVPLHFQVQVITVDTSGQTGIQSLTLDAGRNGELRIPGYGSTISRVTLVISAAAPASTEPAAYRIELALE